MRVDRGRGSPCTSPPGGYHWQRLREYLLTQRGRSETVIDSLDVTTNAIVSMLEDPRPGGPSHFQVRGLVVGYVQSGKTANFSAVIAKAYDAGYRIVIVLSGLHNSLRRQTQLRLEDELGLVRATSRRPGVGLADDDHQITRLTRPDTLGDFDQGTADASVLSSGARTLLVMKKNASVLRRLDSWLKDRSPVGPPVLIIDDEADQASINTGGNRTGTAEEEEDPGDVLDLDPSDVDPAPDGATAGATPSRAQLAEESNPSIINGLMRGLLKRMNRAAYIGYTATPFANVLIGHEDTDAEVGGDLYPNDFILNLPRPPGYVGAERLFGRTALSGEAHGVEALDVIREVPEHEARPLLPRRHEPPPTRIPPSLDAALLDFLLATAARDTRTRSRPAASMLIHTSQRTAPQDALAHLVEDRLASLRQQWFYGMDTSDVRARLQKRWSDFSRVSAEMDPDRTLDFADIEPALGRVFKDSLPVMILHSHSGQELDYEHNPDQRAVLIGGNKLSRGLTLEGLLVSYYVRPANAYDTLLQMGRWFGFRENYVDLTRLYTTTALSDNFRDLATCEEELRQEIRRYEQLGETPADFGPRIRLHPAMAITGRGRMGSARTVVYDYAMRLQQTSAFALEDPDWLQHNIEATRRFVSALGWPGDTGRNRGLTWENVGWSSVADFLDDYNTYEGSTRFIAPALRDHITILATQHRELTRWTVVIRGLRTTDPALGDEDLGIVGGGRVACISRTRVAGSTTSIGTLVNPVSAGGRGDEDLDLTAEDRRAAEEQAQGSEEAYPLLLRARRDPSRGLLVIYPISRHSRPRTPAGETGAGKGNRRDLFDDPDRGRTVIGVAISMPPSNTPDAGRVYVVGSAGPAQV